MPYNREELLALPGQEKNCLGLLSSEAEQIYQLFQPYVTNTNRVVDRNVLNNLLAESLIII